MNKEVIIRKLTSRKLWTAVSGFVSMLIIALGVAKETAVQVSALIMAGASVIAYIVGEGMADAAGAASPVIHLPFSTDGQEEDPDEAAGTDDPENADHSDRNEGAEKNDSWI